MNVVTGTFAAPGQSEPLVGRQVDIALRFTGAGSVDVERQMPSGEWIKIDSAITEDYNEVADIPAPAAIRLNCTAGTGIEYILQTNRDGS